MERRTFLTSLPAVLLAVAAGPRRAAAALRLRGDHPTPRPNVDGSKVLTPEQLADHDEGTIALFDRIREIPQVVDGIKCYCGCDELEDTYSLLSCYENGMASHCYICQGEGRMAADMHAQGKTLEEIRAAIDTEFGY